MKIAVKLIKTKENACEFGVTVKGSVYNKALAMEISEHQNETLYVKRNMEMLKKWYLRK